MRGGVKRIGSKRPGSTAQSVQDHLRIHKTLCSKKKKREIKGRKKGTKKKIGRKVLLDMIPKA